MPRVTVSAVGEQATADYSLEPTGPGIVSVTNLAGATLTAKIGAANNAGKAVSFPAGVFETVDFVVPANYPMYGVYCGASPKGLLGSGRGATVIQMRPRTSTKASLVPPSDGPGAGAGAVNPLFLARVDGTPEVADMTFLGTDQGHMYNGLQMYVGAGGLVRDVLIKGIPGDSSVNPGETFPLATYKRTGMTFTRVEVDGTNQAGVPVAASGVGVNFGGQLRFDRLFVHHTGYGSGVAAYETADLTFTDCVTEDCAYFGLNFENVSGAVNITRHRFRRCALNVPYATAKNVHMAIATNKGTATYTITDPDFDGPRLRVRVTGYKAGARTQDIASIRLYVKGVDRTMDLLDIVVA